MSNINRSLEPTFERLKIIKKEKLTKDVFLLGVQPSDKEMSNFLSGQYIRLKHLNEERDYSLVSAPYENIWEVAIKINNEYSFAQTIYDLYHIGDEILVAPPMGRFILDTKPQEKRTILGFAAGIGITPILSHLKHILHTEKLTRFFLFYVNKTAADVVFKAELESLRNEHEERLYLYEFFTQDKEVAPLYSGRIDGKKIELIINQILHLDEDDEESTIWDSVDEILICGPGEMVKEVATACYQNGMRKKNIHFELFSSFNDPIFPQDREFPLVENIQVEWTMNGQRSPQVYLENNKGRLLNQLLTQGYRLPYSCKSGICGACRCVLEEGEVEMEDNEYLTDKETEKKEILPCTSIVLSQKIKLNFDLL